MNWFSRFAQSNKDKDEDGPQADDAPGMRLQEREGMVTVDLDSFSPESHAELTEEIVRRSRYPLFKGSVTHAYSTAFTGNTGTCPRCGSPTQQHTANFIYATDMGCRAILAPAGHFCQACPTVIVDDQLISTGMKTGYHYRRVVGVDYFGQKKPDYFGTWNGEKPIYILDENEQITDMVVGSEGRKSSPRAQPHPRNAAKKAKRKQADKARRRNRKRR